MNAQPDDFQPQEDEAVEGGLFNLEVEQVVLGEVMVKPERLDRIAFLKAEHFCDPLHQRIYAQVLTLTRDGKVAVPKTLKAHFAGDADLKAAGGAKYLAGMAAGAGWNQNIEDYATVIVDLWRRRQGVATYMEGMDALADISTGTAVDAVMESIQGRITDIQSEGPTPRPQQVGGLMDGVMQKVQDAMNGLHPLPSTGIKTLDEMIGGLAPGNLTLLAGRPGMGKTALGLSIVRKAVLATPGIASAFFSLEMTANECILRMACETASTDAWKIPYSYAMRGQIGREQFQTLMRAQDSVINLPLYVDDTPARTAAAISAECRRLHRELAVKGITLGVVAIDHLRYVKDSGNYRNNANKSEGEKATDLKVLAKELKINVIALVQLNRGVETRENKRPSLADLRDSGEIEEAADVAIFPFREAYYKRRNKPADGNPDVLAQHEAELAFLENRMELIVEKNRQGEPGMKVIGCDMGTNRFWDLPPGEQQQGGTI